MMSSELADREPSAPSRRRRSRRHSPGRRFFRRLSKRRIGYYLLVIALGLASLAAAYWVTLQEQ